MTFIEYKAWFRIISTFLILYLQDVGIPTTGGSKSKLPKEVQELVALIFDVDTMKSALVEFEVSSVNESCCRGV